MIVLLWLDFHYQYSHVVFAVPNTDVSFELLSPPFTVFGGGDGGDY